MEPAAARTFEKPANDEVWGPAAGLPVSMDIYAGTWSLQPYVPSSSTAWQQQLVEYNYYAAATQHDCPVIVEQAAAQESLEVDLPHDKQMEMYKNNPILAFEEAERKFEDDTDRMEMKIHRYPQSIQALGDWYTIPRVVAIGPYHHRRLELRHTENVKHVAAYHCMENRSVLDMYDAVVSVVTEIDARSLYKKDVMEGMDDADFLPMMFFDACFLVMYMQKMSGIQGNTMLYDFFESNASEIAHDIMLLENQIPWPVVNVLLKLKYTSAPLEDFVARWKDGCLQDRFDEVPSVVWDDDYKIPHLLGLLRFYTVGSSSNRTGVRGVEKMASMPSSVSAIELAEMGINLRGNKTTELVDMDLTEKPIFFGNLSMAPLSLNDLRASLLVNMAALELCTTPDFFGDEAGFEDSAVCSYLLLLCMLVHRKEDVHQLRKQGILQGGAGLTNTEALDFFTSLQGLRLGRCCAYVLAQIESYRINRSKLIMVVYAFLYNNWKTVAGLVSFIGAFAGLLSTIKSLKGGH